VAEGKQQKKKINKTITSTAAAFMAKTVARVGGLGRLGFGHGKSGIFSTKKKPRGKSQTQPD